MHEASLIIATGLVLVMVCLALYHATESEYVASCTFSCSRSGSTNCWLAAAELLSRYRAIARAAESNENVKVDISLTKTNPKRYNELLYGRKPLEIKAWNLKHAETSLARVVTNEIPKSVLPLLPESERDEMMSKVLERSGLRSSNEDKGGSLISQHCRLTIVSVIVCSFALGGCILGCRFKRRNAGGR